MPELSEVDVIRISRGFSTWNYHIDLGSIRSVMHHEVQPEDQRTHGPSRGFTLGAHRSGRTNAFKVHSRSRRLSNAVSLKSAAWMPSRSTAAGAHGEQTAI
jgi:hypothetical protein